MPGGMRTPPIDACARRALATALAVAAFAIAPSGAAAQASLRQAGDSQRTVAEVSAYWTPERMEKAKPLGVLSVDGAPPRASTRDASGGPAPRAGTSGSFTSFELTDTLSFPNRVHGKVFFTRPGVGNFVCSGTVVDAGNRSTVITAGHCVHDGGAWSTNFAFAPGYRNVGGAGNAPFGVWPASDEAAPQPWVDSENLKYDVGAAVIARNGSGQSLENVVGGRSVVFNQPIPQSVRSYGYPAQPTSSHPFDGTRLWACDSSATVADNPTTATGPNTLGIGCDMTGGASGGGWVADPSSGALNGVNSYKYTNQPNMMYGPYFGSTVQALYNFAAATPPGSPGSSGAGNSIPAVDSLPARRATCKKGKKRIKGRRACKSSRQAARRR
jgi:V8-like Glu-specific endopeptidase